MCFCTSSWTGTVEQVQASFLLSKTYVMKHILMLVTLLAVSADVFSQGSPVGRDEEGAGRPVLWRDPGPIAAKDLFWGPATPDGVPKPPFSFVEEDTGGTKPKIVVTDANGVTWKVKFAGPSASNNEVHAEIAATRLAWAFGYLVEEHHYVSEGRIENVKGLRRAARSVGADGTFRVARFEKRPADVTRAGGHWSLDDNPFADTRELSGFKILIALLNNWDTKTSNFSVVHVTATGELEDWYLISDWGSTFGRMGPPALFPSRNRWSLRDYQQEAFIDRVDDRYLHLNHDGDHVIRKVPIAHARWLAELASELSADQVRRAFEASGASADEIAGFSARVMEKLAQLQSAVGVRQAA